jgi:uncharacterized low-complexity protein
MRRPRYADVVSTLALLLALSGTAYAATALAANSVGTTQLKNDAVTAAKIKAGAVGSSEVAADALTLADIKGTDITGKLGFSIGIWDCEFLALTVPGAKAGQVAVFSFTKPDAIPEGIASTQPTVEDGKVTLQFCNVDTASDSPIEVSGVPYRVVTFG